MTIDHYQHTLTRQLDRQWTWATILWFTPGLFADVMIKGTRAFNTKTQCVKDRNELLSELGLNMNKNTKRRKAENPGAHQPRKSSKPKVGASAAEITRRISKERGS